MDTQFAINLRGVRFDRAEGDDQVVGELLSGETRRQQRQNLLFTRGQALKGCSGGRMARRRSATGRSCLTLLGGWGGQGANRRQARGPDAPVDCTALGDGSSPRSRRLTVHNHQFRADPIFSSQPAAGIS
jgi:hypothetical protein